MSAIRLLHPREIAVRQVVSQTARAFRMGPQIAPHRAAYVTCSPSSLQS
jgi:hypothetical protein